MRAGGPKRPKKIRLGLKLRTIGLGSSAANGGFLVLVGSVESTPRC